MSPLELFLLTQKPPTKWKVAGKDTDYCIIETPTEVILSFKGTDSDIDWKINFDFWVRPYQKQPQRWYTHRGFARAWKLAKDQIVSEVIAVLKSRKLIIIGYSHGADITILAHEYFWFNDYDPNSSVFGPARLCWLPSKAIRGRFSKLNCYMTYGDIVTHVPFWVLGYRHVGRINKVGRRHFVSHKPHLKAAYIEALSN